MKALEKYSPYLKGGAARAAARALHAASFRASRPPGFPPF